MQCQCDEGRSSHHRCCLVDLPYGCCPPDRDTTKLNRQTNLLICGSVGDEGAVRKGTLTAGVTRDHSSVGVTSRHFLISCTSPWPPIVIYADHGAITGHDVITDHERRQWPPHTAPIPLLFCVAVWQEPHVCQACHTTCRPKEKPRSSVVKPCATEHRPDPLRCNLLCWPALVLSHHDIGNSSTGC
jgi:hypothetical protein